MGWKRKCISYKKDKFYYKVCNFNISPPKYGSALFRRPSPPCTSGSSRRPGTRRRWPRARRRPCSSRPRRRPGPRRTAPRPSRTGRRSRPTSETDLRLTEISTREYQRTWEPGVRSVDEGGGVASWKKREEVREGRQTGRVGYRTAGCGEHGTNYLWVSSGIFWVCWEVWPLSPILGPDVIRTQGVNEVPVIIVLIL